jgi:hypothetical protein
MTEHDKKWNMQHEQLVEFKRTNGHCLVPQKCEQDKSLGEWVNEQRTLHNNDKIQLDRKTILDDIGFAWKVDVALTLDQKDKLWHQQHGKLVEHKRINGNCRVPSKNQQDKFLAQWVRNHRCCCNKNKMQPDRKELLDALKFVWKPDDKLWHQQHEKPLEHERIDGHCEVPNKCNDDKSLGWWAVTQRARHANDKMPPDRKELLDALDFVCKARSFPCNPLF